MKETLRQRASHAVRIKAGVTTGKRVCARTDAPIRHAEYHGQPHVLLSALKAKGAAPR